MCRHDAEDSDREKVKRKKTNYTDDLQSTAMFIKN